jgi:hypothetical protein
MLSTFEVLVGRDAQAASDEHARQPFQRPAWAQAVSVARGRRHEFVAVRATTGTRLHHLFGAVHRRFGLQIFESMPFGGYGGWTGRAALDEAGESALTREWLGSGGWPCMVLVGEPGRRDALPDGPSYRRLGAWVSRLRPVTHLTHLLRLDGSDADIISRAKPRMRSYLRRIEDAGYECRLERSGSEIRMADWYRQGSAAWQSGNTLPMPDAFFDALQASSMAEVWSVHRDDQCVAAALFLLGKDSISYQASGSLRHQGTISPMDALIWVVAREYRDRGYRVLNLGASEGLDSVRQFKEKFGALPAEYRRAVYVFPRFLMGRVAPDPTAA